MTLIRTDTLEPWQGEPLPMTVSTAEIHRADGTVETVEVEPYTFDVRHPLNIGDMWSDEELARAGLARPIPFEAPEGKRRVGPSSYELREGKVYEVSAVEDIPPPPPVVEPEPLTPEEKLHRAGLTIEELKALLKD